MFSIEFVSLSVLNNTNYYRYEVIWSVPTKSYPEPQVTVFLKFRIAVKLDYPSHYPVNVICKIISQVTYIIEARNMINRLDTKFQPKWLYDVLDMKTMMFKSFEF
ncbi:PREDICTED: uncharacterized protein LOC107069306 [Polistes dominula]|uniref:Uncharacterized protein LOC107069306 n=1 Tax=Polistes dominula TaxID=743375 RepID=A0ABM1IP62_POLDO|nr:PREDICTED: uncharacterized protein LOC107069306 [Polistes dominula]